MAEIGTPRAAASSSAATYGFERITAVGSIAGGPSAAGASGWPAAADEAPGGPFRSVIRGPAPSVAGSLFDLFAFGRGGAALLVQGGAGVLDVLGEPVDLFAAHGLLDQGAHDLHVLRVRGQRVGGDHPAAFGGELPGDVGLVIGAAVLGLEPERDQREL